MAAGHEGVVIKSPVAAYDAGRRGAAWVKVKPVHTLDLVVLAVEWGSGRRRGWLSNLHLGARDPASGEFVMFGKTFKGMTDEMLVWQTGRFQELQVSDDGWVVTVRPEQVVEIAFDGVQRSTRYPGGVALRFAGSCAIGTTRSQPRPTRLHPSAASAAEVKSDVPHASPSVIRTSALESAHTIGHTARDPSHAAVSPGAIPLRTASPVPDPLRARHSGVSPSPGRRTRRDHLAKTARWTRGQDQRR